MARIALAETAEEIEACYPVLEALRPHVAPDSFVERIRRQQAQGYRLAYLAVGADVLAVAGFRVSENLAWGRFLYVDDLVTAAASRSKGYGGELLDWLVERARTEGCAALHLDSGVQRRDAHRFYASRGMTITSHHFGLDVKAVSPK